MSKIKSNGFSLVGGILILVVVGIVVAVGWLAYTNFLAPQETDNINETSDASSVANEPVAVEDADDLDKALAELDAVDVSDDEGAVLDTAADSF